jgi:hypothetical protein
MANFLGRKTGLIIPYWLANLFPDGVKYAKMEKRPVLWVTGFWAGLLSL